MLDSALIDLRSLPSVQELPVFSCLDELKSALLEKKSAVLSAAPGAGKSTLVPLSLLGQPWLGEQKILLLQPRRVATVGVASRMASLLGEKPGQIVGWRMAFDVQVSLKTRIEVLTEGILSRLLLEKPDLPGVGLVIFDEFHERSQNADLALAFALASRVAFRPDLRILVMSASLNESPVSKLLDDCPVIKSAGRVFPVSIAYQPPPNGADWWHNVPAFCRHVTSCVAAIAEKPPDANATSAGDILVFLPGRHEIERVARELENARLPEHVQVQTLAGGMDSATQAAILHAPPQGIQRVVLSTSVAETSLTIPGVTTVVDSGLARQPVFDARLGMDRLETLRVSNSSATQRSGRAGRTAAGKCLRLWPQEEQLPDQAAPEIEREDLASFVLCVAAWGEQSASALPFVTPVSSALWNQARALLLTLGFLEKQSEQAEDLAFSNHAPHLLPPILEAGRQAIKLGMHPRLAAMVLGARPDECYTAVALSVVLDGSDQRGQTTSPDLRDELSNIHGWHPQTRKLLERRLHAANQIRPSTHQPQTTINYSAIAALLASAFPDRIGTLISDERTQAVYRLSSGRQAITRNVAPHPWIVAADLDAGDEYSLIRRFVPLEGLEREAVLTTATDRLTISWDGWIPRVRKCRVLGELVLSETALSVTENKARVQRAVGQALAEKLYHDGLDCLPFNEAGGAFLTRLRYAAVQKPESLPDLGAEKLAESACEWLLPHGTLASGKPFLDAQTSFTALKELVGYQNLHQLDNDYPTHYTLPNGRSVAFVYPTLTTPAEPNITEDGTITLPQTTLPPVSLSMRLQDAFGIAHHPTIGGVPVRVHLLSPARRPLQITQDLPGFWTRSYPEIRKEMRGRYPKHKWPEHPESYIDTTS